MKQVSVRWLSQRSRVLRHMRLEAELDGASKAIMLQSIVS